MSNEVSKDKDEAKKKGGKIALIVCVVIILALLGVVIFLLFNKGKKEEQPKRNVVVNEENVGEIIEQMQNSQRVDPGNYEMTMNSTWYFEDGAAASSNAYVENSVANTKSVYFDVQRTDTGETIYESPILPVGSHLEGITLDTKLPTGTYDCVLIYYLLDEEDNPESTVRISVTIVVGE